MVALENYVHLINVIPRCGDMASVAYFEGLYWLATIGGRVPVVPFASCTRNDALCYTTNSASLETKATPQNRLVKFFCLGGKRYTILPTYPHANIIAFVGEDNFSNRHNYIQI